jgi:hypothetical protein
MEHPATVIAQEEEIPSSLTDLLTLVPMVNPTVSLRHCSYPILDIAELIEQDEHINIHTPLEQPSSFAAFRPPDAYYCKLLDLFDSATVVLEAALTQRSTYGELAKLFITSRLPEPPEDSSLQFIEMIEDFHELGLFIGADKTDKAYQ